DADLLGAPGLFTPVRIFGPLPGQVEFSVQESPAAPTREGQEHADLAILDPPGGAAVLPLDAGRLAPLLEEAGLVHNEHAVGVGQVFQRVGPEIVPDSLRIPVGPPQQVLDPVRTVVAEVLGQLPAVLALGVAEQATQVIQGPGARLGAREVFTQPRAHALEFVSPTLNILSRRSFLGHGMPPSFLAVAILLTTTVVLRARGQNA